MSLNEIVQVNITRETSAVTVAGFGIGMILGTHKRFNELSKSYDSLQSIGADFQSTDKEYIWARDYFAQSPSPVSVVIGRRATNDKIVVTVASALDNTDYTVTINGTDFTYGSGVGATSLTIAAGLVGVINGGSEPVTATDNSDGTFDLDPDVAGTPYTFDYTPTLLTIPSYTTTQAIGNDLTAINDYDSSWYGLAITDRDSPTQLLAAAWTEANKKIFGVASSDSDIGDTTDAADTTTIAAQLKAASYDRTYSGYIGDVANYAPDTSVFAYTATRDPGSYSVFAKSMPGIPVTRLTPTQSTNIRAKNCLAYETIGGNNILREGKVASGEFIDTIIFVDWLEARIQEAVFSRFVNLAKIPYTNEGVQILVTEIKGVLNLGVERGGLVEDSIVITYPDVADVSANDKANRYLPDIKFTATLQGAIHKVKIDGVVSV